MANIVLVLLVALWQGRVATAAGTPFPEPPNTPVPGYVQQEPHLYEDYDLMTQGYQAGLLDATTGQFNPYGSSYHAAYDDEYFMPDDPVEKLLAECSDKENGTPLNNTRACEIRVTGGNAKVPGLSGGVNGLYKPVACNDGRPMYLRQKSPPHEDRVLWYSNRFADWNLANSTQPVEDADNTVAVMYGGSAREIRPQHVHDWQVSTYFTGSSTNSTKADYVPINITIACANLTGSGKSPFKTEKGGEEGGEQQQQQQQQPPSQPEATPGPAGATQQQQQQQGQEGQQQQGQEGQQQQGQEGQQQQGQEGQQQQGQEGQQQEQQPGVADGEGGKSFPGGGEDAATAQGEDWGGMDDDGMPDGEEMDWREDLSAEQAASVQSQGLKGPMLTQEEMERQYSMIYKRAQAAQDAQRRSNRVFIMLFLVAAVGIAVGGPLVYVQKQRAAARTAAEDGGPVYISLSQAFRGRRGVKREQQE